MYTSSVLPQAASSRVTTSSTVNRCTPRIERSSQPTGLPASAQPSAAWRADYSISLENWGPRMAGLHAVGGPDVRVLPPLVGADVCFGQASRFGDPPGAGVRMPRFTERGNASKWVAAVG
jgi:hypothetical protein